MRLAAEITHARGDLVELTLSPGDESDACPLFGRSLVDGPTYA
jgi:hypothetical protein